MNGAIIDTTCQRLRHGCVIGSLLSAANLYTGFTIGWTYGASITAAISAWVVFKGWGAVAKGEHFTVLENNTMQTSASAAAAMAGAGMVNAVPALMILTHRELGFDTPTFSGALKAAMREDPDVVLVGELRDLETMSLALQAAETGLLVFGTLHTNSAAKAVDRLIDSFPAEEQEQTRTVLAEVLKAVVAQVLLKRKGGGRIPAFEVLRSSPALGNNIREGKTAMINTLIQTGRNAGMIGMDQSLADLVVADLAAPEEAFEKALEKESFKSLVEKRRAAAKAPAAAAAPSR
jgi:hypothetical protein